MRRGLLSTVLLSTVLLCTVLLCTLGFSFTLGAQSKPPIARADYGQWETLSAGGGGRGGAGGGGGGFSADGKWLTYSISRQNQSSELRLVKLADHSVKTVPFGSQLAFTSDSKWAGYSIGYSEAEQERMRAAQRPIQNKLALVNLASGETSTVDGIQSFTFSPDGAYVAMRPYPPSAPGGGAAAARGGAAPAGGGRGGGRGGVDTDNVPVGGSLIVRQLATGRDTTFGNVGELAWQDAPRSHWLALTISAEGKVGNAIQLFDPETTILRVLESSPASYTALTWRKDAPDLAAFRSRTDPKKEGPAQSLVAWTGLGRTETRHIYDSSIDTSFPAGMRLVSFRRPSWSDDGSSLFFGVAKWGDVPPPARGRGAGARGGDGSAENSGRASTPPPDEPATVDVWHWLDPVVSPRVKLSAAADRRRNLLAVWHLDTNTFVQIGKSFDESVSPMRRSNTAYVAEWAAYAMDRSIGRPAADLYLADLTTGARTKLKDKLNDGDVQVGPSGKFLLFLQDDQFSVMNLSTKTVTNLTKMIPTSFVDKDSDATVKQKPDFGVGGWTKDDAAVILYDRFDIWKVPTDGSKAQKLTGGAAEQVRHRLLRIGQEEDWLDLSKPIYVSLFGAWSKKSGYGLLKPAGGVDRLVFLDKSVAGLAKAREADVYAYTIQDYNDSPDLFVGGADLETAKQVTNTNEFQSKFAWGRSETVDFATDKGLKLQGTLYYPAGYEAPRPGSEQAGRKYPMIVYLYEKLSDGVHGYVVPSDKSYYNITVFMSQGYFVFEPDIVFTPRQPGLSVVECVTAGIKKVTSMGVVDPRKVGVIGHSWGGFDTAFLATHTNGVFAAAIAGAPITDLVSNYGNHHWSSGIAETDHIETGQQRMEVPLYDALPDYIANSAVFNVQNMTVPLLIEVGDADGTVFWHQGVELYNIARRAKKNVVLIQYEGEDHGLRQPKNQIDYQKRILEWFGYYLKGDEGPAWIVKGTER